mgnify:FL=1
MECATLCRNNGVKCLAVTEAALLRLAAYHIKSYRRKDSLTGSSIIHPKSDVVCQGILQSLTLVVDKEKKTIDKISKESSKPDSQEGKGEISINPYGR